MNIKAIGFFPLAAVTLKRSEVISGRIRKFPRVSFSSLWATLQSINQLRGAGPDSEGPPPVVHIRPAPCDGPRARHPDFTQ